MLIHTTIRMINRTYLGQSKTGGFGSNSGEAIPLILGDVLGDETVLGLNVGEWRNALERKEKC